MELTQKGVYHLIKQFAGQANVLTMPRVFVDLTGGDHIAALLLNQIIYWTERTKDPEGWFYKSHKEWDEELGLSQFQINRALKTLKPLGVETKLKRANKAPTLHYRLDRELFSNSIMKFLDNRETQKSRNSINMDYEVSSQSDYEVSSQSLTETTTEITTENTRAPRHSNFEHQKPSTEVQPVNKIINIPTSGPTSNFDRRIQQLKEQFPPDDITVAIEIARDKGKDEDIGFIRGTLKRLTDAEREKYRAVAQVKARQRDPVLVQRTEEVLKARAMRG